MKQVGVIRKNMGPLSLQVPLGESGFYFTPLSGTGTAEPTANPNVRSARDFSTASISAENAREKLRQMAADRQAAFNRDPDSSFGGDAAEIARQQEERALQRVLEAGEAQNQQERYISESLDRQGMRGPVGVMGPITGEADRAAALAERAGRFGMAGRTAGTGVAGALAGLTGLIALQNAGAQGQDAISGLGSAGLKGMGTFSTANPVLERAGGYIGSRIGDSGIGMTGEAFRAGPASQMAGRASGASQMAGRGGRVGVVTVPKLHRTPGVADSIAPPAPTPPTVAEPTSTNDDGGMSEKVAGYVGVATKNPVKETEKATNATDTMGINQSMVSPEKKYASDKDMERFITMAGPTGEKMPRGTGRDGSITERDLQEAE